MNGWLKSFWKAIEVVSNLFQHLIRKICDRSLLENAFLGFLVVCDHLLWLVYSQIDVIRNVWSKEIGFRYSNCSRPQSPNIFIDMQWSLKEEKVYVQKVIFAYIVTVDIFKWYFGPKITWKAFYIATFRVFEESDICE